MPKLLSIVIPCYRQAALVGDAVASVVDLVGSEALEVIVVDDGSPDDVAAAVAPWEDRVRLIRQTNQGLSGARNTGIQAATGDYLMFLDADDVAHPELAQALPLLGEFDAFLGDYVIERVWSGEQSRHRAMVDGGVIGLASRNLGPPLACIVRRERALQVGGFDPDLRSCEDWDFWIRLWRTEPRWTTLEPAFGVYRLYESSMVTDYARMWLSARSVWNKHIDLVGDLRRAEADFYKNTLHDRVCAAYLKCESGQERLKFLSRLIVQSLPTARYFVKSRLSG